ncbi:MAG: DUF4166 domain-containing protein [gamma proteobacterium symbiont of Taylorina sp.]|nr:DUF4166 domain-containing protein [gamma proteobacterium symbiont of Taylorina sp.]
MFKNILSNQWTSLSPILQKHYGINDGEEIKMQGELAVKHGRFIKLLMPFIRLTGALVPVEGEKFIVTVENKRIGNSFYWHRAFKKDNKSYEFNSKMQQFDNDIVEFVGLGIGIRMGLQVSDGGLVYEDKGYVLKVGNKLLPIPLHFLIGKSVIEEFVSNNDSNDFNMRFVVNHPWFGFAFSYSGYFTVFAP